MTVPLAASTRGAGAGDRKRGHESGQDQIWRYSGARISAQAEQDCVGAEHPPATVILGRAASAFWEGKLRHEDASMLQSKFPGGLRV